MRDTNRFLFDLAAYVGVISAIFAVWAVIAYGVVALGMKVVSCA